MPDLPHEDILSHLRPALESWTSEAVSFITSHKLVLALPNERWHLHENGYHVRGSELVYVLSPGAPEALQRLPSYKVLEDAARASPIIAPMLGLVYGTPRMGREFSVWVLANAFIPDFNDILSEGQTYSFEERYTNVVNELTEREVEYQVTSPPQGVSVQEVVELAPSLLIAPLTADEIADALLTNVLPAMSNFPALHIQEGNSCALKKISRLPTTLRARDEPPEPPDVAFFAALSATEESDQLLQCMALMTHQQISVSGSMTKSRHRYYLLDDSGIISGGLQSTYRYAPDPFRLDAPKCEELKHLWALSHDESFPQNKALALALRRLAFATQRTRPEDRLLDVFIAAEALYLTDTGDIKDRGELKYRLALRAAVWSEDALPGWTRREVFHQMKRGYDVRSAVAHGGTPKPKDIKVKGDQVSLATLVEVTEEIVRSALYKALRQLHGVGRRLSIAWDDLVLPDEPHGAGET